MIDASVGPHDVTAVHLNPGRVVSQHVARIRAFDWAATDLGPMHKWDADLRRIVNLCMADPRPVALWWGPNRTCLYNDPYVSILAERNAWAMGKPASIVWKELLTDSFGLSFDKGDATGEPSFGEDTCFFVERNGHLEEVWASWAVIPIPGVNGNIGFYNAVTETTMKMQYDRRMNTLLALERSTTQASDFIQLWDSIMAPLASSELDVPFALLYSATQDVGLPVSSRLHSRTGTGTGSGSGSEDSASSFGPSPDFSRMNWSLESSLGLTSSRADDPLSLSNLNLDSLAHAFVPAFAKAAEAREPQLIQLDAEDWSKALRRKIQPRGYNEQPRTAVLIPIGQARKRMSAGFLVLGLNARCSYNRAYEHFINQLVREINTAYATVANAEQQTHQTKVAAQLAAQDRIQLVSKLAATEQEVSESNLRFRTMADNAPVAIFELSAIGELEYANEKWLDLTEHDENPQTWVDIIHEEDRAMFDFEWARVFARDPVNFEVRFAKPFDGAGDFVNGESVQGETWVLAAAYPHLRTDGSLRSVIGCFVDISRQKWMEGFQERRTVEALEMKRQQEIFMDMTSHEARNPLAAIMLSAESIIDTLDVSHQHADNNRIMSEEMISSSLENAEIILSCAQHQKKIMDDVLVSSKLSLGLMTINPAPTQLASEIAKTLKIFQKELDDYEIDLNLVIDETYRSFNIDWLNVDSGRVLQVVINLVSNAIKFTKSEPKRNITITLSATKDRPQTSLNGIKFVQDTKAKDRLLRDENDDEIYLSIAVRDTGRGIKDYELEHLFQRFRQASTKTEVKYGGSGLGLFISRELARLQGGEIGATSKMGAGSTFAFFIEATRCSQLPEPPTVGMKRKHVSSPNIEQPFRFDTTQTAQQGRSNGVNGHVPHVLLVEDNLVNQKVMSKQLRKTSYEVTVANHGEEALIHINGTSFRQAGGSRLDLVLMDMEMPVMDGLTCTRVIRKMEETKEIKGHIPVIAVTANARGEQQTIALEAGVDSVVTKPFRMREFLPELERIMSLRQ